MHYLLGDFMFHSELLNTRCKPFMHRIWRKAYFNLTTQWWWGGEDGGGFCRWAALLLPEAPGAQTTKTGSSCGSLFFGKRKHDKLIPVVWDFEGLH